MIKIEKLKDLGQRASFNIVLHGQSGAGKTFSVRTLPEINKTLIIDWEQGLKSIVKACPEVQIYSPKKIEEMSDIAIFLSDDNGDKIKNVVIDSTTEMVDVLLRECLEKTKNPNPMQAYGKVLERSLNMVRFFNDLPQNIIWICHQELIKGNDGSLLSAPSLAGKKLPEKFPYFFDGVIEAYVAKNPETQISEYLFRCKTNGFALAKIRDPFGLINEIEPPDWRTIFGKMSGDYSPEK